MADARTTRLQLFTVIIPEPEARTARLQLFTVVGPPVVVPDYDLMAEQIVAVLDT